MEPIANISCFIGLAIGYLMVSWETKGKGRGYIVIAVFCLILAASYALKALGVFGKL